MDWKIDLSIEECFVHVYWYDLNYFTVEPQFTVPVLTNKMKKKPVNIWQLFPHCFMFVVLVSE